MRLCLSFCRSVRTHLFFSHIIFFNTQKKNIFSAPMDDVRPSSDQIVNPTSENYEHFGLMSSCINWNFSRAYNS